MQRLPALLEQRSFRYLPMDVVYTGVGSLERLPEALDTLRNKRVMLVTGRTLGRSDIVDGIRNSVGDRIVGHFAEATEHAPYGSVEAGIAAARDCNPDVLVSLGGGSAIDTARAIALAIGEKIRSAEELRERRARFEPPDKVTIPSTSGRALAHIAIPTTLSAAEFANAGAVTNEAEGTKDLFIADELTPRAVILDPAVATATPMELWLASGMRALDHAIETVYSPRHQPLTDVLSLEAIRRLPPSLKAARSDPNDVVARAEGQMGAWFSYFGEMNLTLGLSHAIGHQLGPKCGLAHGVTSCIVLPQVMRYVAESTVERQALIAEALGVSHPGTRPAEAAEAAASAIESLASELGLPTNFRDVGVGEERFDEIAAGVLQDLVVAGSPVPIESPAQITEILRMAK